MLSPLTRSTLSNMTCYKCVFHYVLYRHVRNTCGRVYAQLQTYIYVYPRTLAHCHARTLSACSSLMRVTSMELGMWKCTYIYIICLYTCVYIYMYIYIYTYLYTYRHAHNTCMHVCIYIYMYVCMYVCMYVYTCTLAPCCYLRQIAQTCSIRSLFRACQLSLHIAGSLCSCTNDATWQCFRVGWSRCVCVAASVVQAALSCRIQGTVGL